MYFGQVLDLLAEKYCTLSLPGITVSVQDMVDSLQEIAGEETVQKITWEHDPFIQRIVGSEHNSVNFNKLRELSLLD